MRKLLMDKAGDDLDSFLNDFWLYLDETVNQWKRKIRRLKNCCILWLTIVKNLAVDMGKTRIVYAVSDDALMSAVLKKV